MSAYSPEFFENFRQSSRRSADVLLPLVLGLVRPASVVDVGCGTGTWLAACRDLGVDDVLGVDGDYVDPAALQIPRDRFRTHDLKQPLRLDRRRDMAISLEVAEHLPDASARGFVESLTLAAPVVLFSAAIPHQGGTHHVNEQWPEYWAGHFAAFGYVPIDCIRARIWTDARISWWYRQNTILFVDEAHVRATPALLEARTSGPDPLPLVHPEKFLVAARRAEARNELRSVLGDAGRILRGRAKRLIAGTRTPA